MYLAESHRLTSWAASIWCLCSAVWCGALELKMWCASVLHTVDHPKALFVLTRGIHDDGTPGSVETRSKGKICTECMYLSMHKMCLKNVEYSDMLESSTFDNWTRKLNYSTIQQFNKENPSFGRGWYPATFILHDHFWWMLINTKWSPKVMNFNTSLFSVVWEKICWMEELQQ